MLITTNMEQEARWLYAKGLELAILIKGPVEKEQIETTVNQFFLKDHNELAIKIARKISISALELIPKG